MIYSEIYKKSIEQTVKDFDLFMLREKKIIVTGATGLIGSTLIDFLLYLNEAKGYNTKIYAAVRDEEKAKKRFENCWATRSLFFLEYDACQNITFDIDVDFVIHAASNADPQKFNKEPVETIMANINGTYNLLKYLKEHKGTRFLFVSSSEVYGKKKEETVYVENDFGYVDILNPRSCYPASKRTAETLCAAYKEEFGIDFVIVRPGHIYGPAQTETDSRASAQFLRDCFQGKKLVMKSKGQQLRSYCHSFDCATAVLTVLLKGICGEAYNISFDKSIVTIRDFAEKCAEIGQTEISFEIATASEKKSYNMMENSALDSQKLESIGWKGVWGLEEGLTITYKIFNSKKNIQRKGETK